MFKSQAELQKFFEENPDPLGVQKSGGYKEYTMQEVALHNAPPSIWSVYKGAVYDITMYVNVHPGGQKMLEKVYGKDMTGLFNIFILKNFILFFCFKSIIYYLIDFMDI